MKLAVHRFTANEFLLGGKPSSVLRSPGKNAKVVLSDLGSSESLRLSTYVSTWGICTRRAGQLYRARSRLYRSQILQVNPTSKYSFESSRRDLHNTRLCTDLRSFRLNIVKKVQYYWKAPRRAGPFCLFFLKSAKLLNCLA